jgi:predicted RNase H-like nuclease (RuvC/YqgF family)
MPSFVLNFEVFCSTCGNGLCHESETRKSRQRNEDQVKVKVCQSCVNKQIEPYQEKIEELKDIINDLEDKIENLEDKINKL